MAGQCASRRKQNHSVRNLRSGTSRACILAALLAAGCASESTVRRYVPQIITPYRIDIQQGNFVTQDMVDKLAVGQTREQVRFILGTPVLSDIFHARRWDYVFRLTRGWGDPQSHKLAVFFDEGGKLERWETDLAPPEPKSSSAAPAPAAGGATDPAAPRAAEAGVAVGAAAPSVPAAPAVPAPPRNEPATATPVQPASATGPAQEAAPPTPVAASNPVPPAAAPQAVPAEARSAPTATTAVAPGPADAILAAIERWRSAWSARDVDAYLSMYAESFRPPAGMSRAQWTSQRRERLKRAGRIDVKVVDPQVHMQGTGEALAEFTQVYESDVLKESGRKTLALVQDRGDWRIRQESFGK